MSFEVTLPAEAQGERWDHAIRDAIVAAGHEASVREVRAAMKSGAIRVEGRRAVPGGRAEADVTVHVELVLRAEAELVPDHALAARVERIFEDDELLVLAKPSGVPTTPIRADERGTLLHAAVALAPQIADAGPPLEGGAVHRLDTPTSGVVVFAKDRRTRAMIRNALRAHEIEKRYTAIVHVARALEPGAHFRVTLPIAQRARRVRAEETKDGLEAISDVVVTRTAGERASVEVRTRYGRRHQVRAHLASIPLPIVGDDLYGSASDDGRLALHASSLRLPDGRTFEAPLPPDFVAMLARAGLGS